MRHGEVHNPQGILYGRMPGFGLSVRGNEMARRVLFGKGRQGHCLALAVEHIQAQKVVGLHAGGRIGLHHDALQAASVGKIVHVARPQRGGNGAVDGVKTHAQRKGALGRTVRQINGNDHGYADGDTQNEKEAL